MTIGETIKHYRRLRGLNQTELSKSMGVCRETISLWENGRRFGNLSFKHAQRISKHLVFSLDSISEDNKCVNSDFGC